MSEPAWRRVGQLGDGWLASRVTLVRTLKIERQTFDFQAPKVYLRDSGLLHALLGLAGEREILSHPKVGASWEGYVIEETLTLLRPEAAYFWATHTGAELDLLLVKRGRRYGVEVKFQDAPRLTPSMRIALSDLRLQQLTVLYPGDQRYALDPRVTVVPLAELATHPEVVTRS